MAATAAGCQHYVRKCLLKAPCCKKFYVCRLCHDDDENHKMDRFQVKEVKCTVCESVQESQQVCHGCGVTFSEYYCGICHLFDKDKKQFHCQQCGICRIGPREKFFHCEKCNLCLANDLQGKHKCVENVSRQDCPVCMEDIHTSRIGAHVLLCGHLLHKTCFELMCKNGAYRCPLCMHSALDMKGYWEERDAEIAESPMPPELKNRKVKILCNDCQHRCTVDYHVLGMKCNGCGSYNTSQD
ncbi:RING finger and CHY zinc finger domain-containing protein 1 [Tachysurus fulvidraco]|uniref:RING finger and CHY zinc finger domain-containing protein 1 n=1 Tax=Tachysurus fulvidraco TaxID=1234273 RepID=UPI000F50DBE2|nr:RING finger and CHY zinc finger domain-containing protein 1 [Tachysurus fulvidraco]